MKRGMRNECEMRGGEELPSGKITNDFCAIVMRLSILFRGGAMFRRGHRHKGRLLWERIGIKQWLRGSAGKLMTGMSDAGVSRTTARAGNRRCNARIRRRRHDVWLTIIVLVLVLVHGRVGIAPCCGGCRRLRLAGISIRLNDVFVRLGGCPGSGSWLRWLIDYRCCSSTEISCGREGALNGRRR